MNESVYKATPADGAEILRILESSAAQGSMELLYTRRPDAYSSYMNEPGEARVFVSRDGERIVGTCAELIRDVYIGGELRKAAYICGLKKDADYDGSVGFGVRLLKDFCRPDIEFYYCSVVSENTDAQNMFEKSRRIISMEPFADYTTYILSSNIRIKTSKHRLTFRRATQEDEVELLAFLNREGSKKDLFPAFTSYDQFPNLSIHDFYLLTEGDRILCAAALWNQTGYKQYVVKQYRGFMKAARLFNPLISMLRYIRLPKENTSLDFPMLSFFLCQNDSEIHARIFLHEIIAQIRRSYGMFVIGLPGGHFLTPILEKLPSIHFDTKLYRIILPWSTSPFITPDVRQLQPECGLL